MPALVMATILLAVVATPDTRSEALALIERLGGRYGVDPGRPSKPVVYVAMSKVGANGEGLKCLGVFPELRVAVHRCSGRLCIEVCARAIAFANR